MTPPLTEDRTAVGNYFVSNYPPFSFWTPSEIPELEAVLSKSSADPAPLGLYLHIPFCRKRCKFCYFRVYTDKNSREIERYVEALSREVEVYSETAAIRGRRLRFVYFGGGTPSYLSSAQLESLVERLRRSVGWEDAEEVTFECEPGTLTERKLETIRALGVTRLSLGIENFDDAILEENGRAHRSREAYQAYEWARGQSFDSINIDLIAGMVGETDDNWEACIRKTVELAPESVTIYQMELPHNTLYSKQVTDLSSPVADWRRKRDWVDQAFRALEAHGYRVSSAYTLVRGPDVRFAYRDNLWHGADLVGAGVASFGHISGVHYQNLDGFDAYCSSVEQGDKPLSRALKTTPRQRLIRELVLQLKTGGVDAAYFRGKFAVDIRDEFREALDDHRARGLLSVEGDRIELTRSGLLRVDGLLEAFFAPEHRNARYA